MQRRPPGFTLDATNMAATPTSCSIVRCTLLPSTCRNLKLRNYLDKVSYSRHFFKVNNFPKCSALHHWTSFNRQNKPHIECCTITAGVGAAEIILRSRSPKYSLRLRSRNTNTVRDLLVQCQFLMVRYTFV